MYALYFPLQRTAGYDSISAYALVVQHHCEMETVVEVYDTESLALLNVTNFFSSYEYSKEL